MSFAVSVGRCGTYQRQWIPAGAIDALNVPETEGKTVREKAMEKGLKVGSKIRRVTYSNNGRRLRGRGRVIALYPHFFLCRMSSGYKEGFRYNQFLGKESDHVWLEG